jgi:MoaA/NifB/PqqE/SkfB family radical SAM enzyme
MYYVDLNCNAEPLLNKNIIRMIKTIKEVSCEHTRVGFPTNGMLLNKKMAKALVRNGLDLIRISIDGSNPETFEKIRKGARFHGIIRNIKTLNEIKEELGSNTPEIVTVFVAMKKNISELPDLIDLANDLGIKRISVLGLEPYTRSMSEQILYFEEKDVFEEAKAKALNYGMELKIPLTKPLKVKKCLFYHTCIITCEGDVTPCPLLSYDRPFFVKEKKYYHKKLSFGNISERNFYEIWNSKKYVKFRESIRKGNFPLVCRNCLMNQGLIVPPEGIKFI